MSTATLPFHYFLTDNTMTVLVAGRPYSVPRTNEAVVREVVAAINNPNTTVHEMLALLDPKQAANLVVSKLPGVEIKQVDGKDTIFVGGKPIDGRLGKRVLDVLSLGLDPEPWFLLVQKCFDNPFRDAVNELFPLWDKAGTPLTTEGNLLFYRRVDADFFSAHSGPHGKVQYKIGDEVAWKPGPKDKTLSEGVDKTRAMCSTGLHFAPPQYLKHFGGARTLLVEIDPRDIINISASEMKGRCLKLRVVDEVSNDPAVLELKKWPEPVIEVLTNIPEGEPHEAELETIVNEETRSHTARPARKTRKAEKPKKRSADTKAGKAPRSRVVVVETKWAGRLTKTAFRRLVAEHGSLAGIAKHYGISQGTVQGAKKKLGL